MAADKGFSVPTAQQVMEKLALAEAEKAAATARRQAELESEKKMLLEKITKPSGVSDDEALRRVAAIIERAVSNGLTEVQVYRFPNDLCTDRGRAINQQEPGWETTLTGLPKEMYEFWERQLRPRGYKLKCQIVDFPGGMPGDVGFTLKWACAARRASLARFQGSGDDFPGGLLRPIEAFDEEASDQQSASTRDIASDHNSVV